MRLHLIALAAMVAPAMVAAETKMSMVNNLREVAEASGNLRRDLDAWNGNPIGAASLFRATRSIRSLLDRAASDTERENSMLKSRDELNEEDFGLFLDNMVLGPQGKPQIRKGAAQAQVDTIEKTGAELVDKIVDNMGGVMDAAISKKALIEGVPVIGKRVVRSVLDSVQPAALRFAKAMTEAASEGRRELAERNTKRIAAEFDRVDAAFS